MTFVDIVILKIDCKAKLSHFEQSYLKTASSHYIDTSQTSILIFID